MERFNYNKDTRKFSIEDSLDRYIKEYESLPRSYKNSPKGMWLKCWIDFYKAKKEHAEIEDKLAKQIDAATKLMDASPVFIVPCIKVSSRGYEYIATPSFICKSKKDAESYAVESGAKSPKAFVGRRTGYGIEVDSSEADEYMEYISELRKLMK